VRVLRDPATGIVYVWGSDFGRHVDAADYLDWPSGIGVSFRKTASSSAA